MSPAIAPAPDGEAVDVSNLSGRACGRAPGCAGLGRQVRRAVTSFCSVICATRCRSHSVSQTRSTAVAAPSLEADFGLPLVNSFDALAGRRAGPSLASSDTRRCLDPEPPFSATSLQETTCRASRADLLDSVPSCPAFCSRDSGPGGELDRAGKPASRPGRSATTVDDATELRLCPYPTEAEGFMAAASFSSAQSLEPRTGGRPPGSIWTHTARTQSGVSNAW
jgi:hypothetical protein